MFDFEGLMPFTLAIVMAFYMPGGKEEEIPPKPKDEKLKFLWRGRKK